MKVYNFFAHIFAIFAFLTVGSLLMIVALHILSLEDAVFKLRELYASPVQSMQAGLIGLAFIIMGLSFARMIVKKGRDADAVILQGESGPLVVSVSAIEDAIRKVLKRFNLVKECKIKTLIHSKDVEIRLRLVLWAGGRVPELLADIQEEVHGRLQKLLSTDNKIEVSCDVQRIEDHELNLPRLDYPEKQTLSVG